MRCAVSFLGLVIIGVTVGSIAVVIIWAVDKTCTYPRFECDGICHPLRDMCDSVGHCADGWDENGTNCGDLTNFETSIRRMNQSNCSPLKYANKTSYKIPDGDGCKFNVTAKSITCRSRLGKPLIFTQFLWSKLDLEAKSILMNNVFNMKELTSDLNTLELQLLKNNTIKFLTFLDNDIESIQQPLFAHLTHLCRLQMMSNGLTDLGRDVFQGLDTLRLLDLSNNKLHLRDFEFKYLSNLEDLYLEVNSVETVTWNLFSHLKQLKALHLAHNVISWIDQDAFQYNTLLIDIDLGHNRIKTLGSDTFKQQHHLTRIDLKAQGEGFEGLTKTVFGNLTSLISLNVEGLDITRIDYTVFNSMPNLQFVYFSKFQYCRYAQTATRCFPRTDGVSSTEDIIDGSHLRMCVWIIAILAIFGNITVVVSRWRRTSRSPIHIFLKNLAGADFLMGVYLVILAVKDIQYRDAYHEHAYAWGSSWLCTGSGVLAMISAEASLLILTLMSLERYVVISGPFSRQPKLNSKLAYTSMIIIWGLALGMAVTPAFQWRGTSSFYGSTGFCLPLHLDDAYSIGWQYTTFILIGVNSVCLMLVTISYGRLFVVIHKTRLTTPLEKRDVEMAVRFFLMVITDVICWAPIITLKLAVLEGYRPSKNLLGWVMLMILPMNAAINPFLYTFSTGDIRLKIRNFISKHKPTMTNQGCQLVAQVATTETNDDCRSNSLPNGSAVTMTVPMNNRNVEMRTEHSSSSRQQSKRSYTKDANSAQEKARLFD